jgi:uncharacterized protein YgbK (DUF1537 family)
MTRPAADPEFAGVPPVWPEDVLPAIRAALPRCGRQLVVLDDDPTGTQTVRDVAVVTRWDPETLRAEFARRAAGFYILTNSRALGAKAAGDLNREVARNLCAAAKLAGCDFTLASRGDSTLRGHFPLEPDCLAEVCGGFDAILLAPYFEAGGRVTFGDTHFVVEDGRRVPAAETPFARDPVFGYRNSNLRNWVEEKTAGAISAQAVHSLPLEIIRRGGPGAVLEALLALPRGGIVIANALERRDIEVVALAAVEAETRGRRLLFRTAASLVAARLGMSPQPELPADALAGENNAGGLVVVGSHVPKTTEQLGRLRARYRLHEIELTVEDLLDPARRSHAIARAIEAMNDGVEAGRDTVVFTSRTLVAGGSAEANLRIGERVSAALVAVVRGLAARPRFLIAKGGITSSVLATEALGVRRAMVIGQLLSGVPVWQLGIESRFPQLAYVVFPGNVGGGDALAEAVGRFSARAS